MSMRRARQSDDELQLRLEFDGPPRTAEQLLFRLRSLGLEHILHCRLTDNRQVLVSFRGAELRVHRAYLDAPTEVHAAIVLFVNASRRSEQVAARQVLLRHPLPPRALRCAPRRPREPQPRDTILVNELSEWHWQYNERYFGGALTSIPISISGRMRTRLGQYSAATPSGDPAEITISRSHIRRHGWAEALHTLLHEMVHQWQAESGQDIDHGPRFRAKAQEVGIEPSARREVIRKAGAGIRRGTDEKGPDRRETAG